MYFLRLSLKIRIRFIIVDESVNEYLTRNIIKMIFNCV